MPALVTRKRTTPVRSDPSIWCSIGGLRVTVVRDGFGLLVGRSSFIIAGPSCSLRPPNADALSISPPGGPRRAICADWRLDGPIASCPPCLSCPVSDGHRDVPHTVPSDVPLARRRMDYFPNHQAARDLAPTRVLARVAARTNRTQVSGPKAWPWEGGWDDSHMWCVLPSASRDAQHRRLVTHSTSKGSWHAGAHPGQRSIHIDRRPKAVPNRPGLARCGRPYLAE